MDLDQLQSVRDRERDSEGLQELRESFYEDAAEFVRELREERDRAAHEADEPFDDPAVNRLTDRIRTAEGTLEAIYEKRVAKILRAATLAAADLSAELDGMTVEEAELFEALVAEIEENRREVLGSLAGEAGEPAAGVESGEPADGEAAGPADEGPPEGGGGPDPPESASRDESDDDDVERTLVRITDDVGSILGVDDREYDLAEDDVVTLPAANARPLVERGAAERLER